MYIVAIYQRRQKQFKLKTMEKEKKRELRGFQLTWSIVMTVEVSRVQKFGENGIGKRTLGVESVQ